MEIFVFTCFLIIGLCGCLIGMGIAVWHSERSNDDELYIIGTRLVTIGYAVTQCTFLCILYRFVRTLVRFSTKQAQAGIIKLDKRDSKLISLATRM